MIVLGIDPGLRLTGYGCVRCSGVRHELIEAGVFRLGRTDKATGDAASVSSRLVELEADVSALLDRVQPKAVAVEGLFVHTQFLATAMIMGHARGVILLMIAKRRLPLLELKPALVKKSMTGSGRADKGQVQRAVQEYFKLKELPSPPDVADALAIAVCGAERLRLGEAGEAMPLATTKKSRRRTLPRDVLER